MRCCSATSWVEGRLHGGRGTLGHGRVDEAVVALLAIIAAASEVVGGSLHVAVATVAGMLSVLLAAAGRGTLGQGRVDKAVGVLLALIAVASKAVGGSLTWSP